MSKDDEKPGSPRRLRGKILPLSQQASRDLAYWFRRAGAVDPGDRL